jgi:hypothetical protein
LLSAVEVLGWAIGNRIELLEGGSMGEVVPVDEAPERGGWLMGTYCGFMWGGCSCRVEGAIVYYSLEGHGAAGGGQRLRRRQDGASSDDLQDREATGASGIANSWVGSSRIRILVDAIDKPAEPLGEENGMRG